jgi:hypothetical protein
MLNMQFNGVVVLWFVRGLPASRSCRLGRIGFLRRRLGKISRDDFLGILGVVLENGGGNPGLFRGDFVMNGHFRTIESQLKIFPILK